MIEVYIEIVKHIYNLSGGTGVYFFFLNGKYYILMQNILGYECHHQVYSIMFISSKYGWKPKLSTLMQVGKDQNTSMVGPK